MAHITRYPLVSHLRSEPNQHILHFEAGRLVRQGIGLAYWFRPLSAAVAQVPAEDCSATFVLNEKTSDFQQVAVQCTAVYRFTNPEKAAGRLNFTVSLVTGLWPEDPLEKVTVLWSQAARPAVRAYLGKTEVGDAVRNGPALLGLELRAVLAADPAMAEIGIALVSVQVDQIMPTPEVQKALETPTREAIQQKADEAVFQRRALAVEKERAIKQNELQTQVELARRQDDLIRQQGSNKLREVETAAAAERARIEAETARSSLVAEAETRDRKTRADGDAFARRAAAEADATAIRVVGDAEASASRAKLEADTEAELRRLAAWRDLPPAIAMALGVKSFAEKIQKIGDIHLTPDLVGDWLGAILKTKARETVVRSDRE